MKNRENGKLADSPNGENDSLASSDGHDLSKKPAFRVPDKDSLREDSLNRYIEAARVRPLSEFQKN